MHGLVSQIIEVRQRPGSTVVALRPVRFWKPVALLAGFGLAAVAIALALGRPVDGAVSWAAKALFVGGGGLAVLALELSARFLAGRDVVTTSPEALAIEKFVLGWRTNCSRYTGTLVKNLRAVGGDQVLHRGRPTRTIGAVQFDYEGRTVRFGLGLVGAEAERVVQAIRQGMQRYPSPTGSAK